MHHHQNQAKTRVYFVTLFPSEEVIKKNVKEPKLTYSRSHEVLSTFRFQKKNLFKRAPYFIESALEQ